MDAIKEFLSLRSYRRFGAEIEINAFDMRDRPIGYLDGKLPDGIHHVGNLVQKVTNDKVVIHKWSNDHDNQTWIIKPDGSCGMEVCTPVYKGWHGLMRTCRVVDGLKNDKKITSDHRCSFHVHIDVSDLSNELIAAIISWWVKCEPVFMDSVPASRKKNQYCQLIGHTDLFDDIEDGLFSPETLIRRIGVCKYYTMNTFHLVNKKRRTIEFRIMDSECCLDSWMTKNWIRILLHFVERAISRGIPADYQRGNQWSGYCWLDPDEVFDFLGFMPGQYELSPGLEQVRSWFVSRLHKQVRSTTARGVMSEKGRRIAAGQIEQLYRDLSPDESIATEDQIYGENFRI